MVCSNSSTVGTAMAAMMQEASALIRVCVAQRGFTLESLVFQITTLMATSVQRPFKSLAYNGHLDGPQYN